MKLRHQYNSATPYENCGYERIPSYPCVGQEVLINCRLEPGHPDARVRLLWNVDGEGREPVTGKFLYTDGEGRGYYTFPIPGEPEYRKLSYKLEATLGDKTAHTERFQLRPLHWERPADMCLWREGNSRVLLTFRLSEACYRWAWTLEETGAALRLDRGGNLPEGVWEEAGENVLLALSKGRKLSFHREPFSVAFSDGSGGLLLFRGEDVRFYTDSEGKIGRCELSAHVGGTAFYGLGERFNRVNLLNHTVKASGYEKFTNQGEKSYLPIPFFTSDRGYGFLHCAGFESDYTFEELSGGGAARLRMTFACGKGETVSEDRLLFGPVSETVKNYVGLTGKAALPPAWAFGPWMSSNRWEKQAQVEEQLAAMEQHQIPATVMVVERWSDDTTFDCFEDTPRPVVAGREALSRKDFSFAEGTRWPDPFGMAERIHCMGMKLILWQAPILRRPEGECRPQCENDYAYAVERQYCVMMPDGEPFTCPEGWFRGSLLIDFTNPEAVEWWMKKREWLLTELGADGFKTDSGELVADDRCLFSNGMTGKEGRNLYPMYYERAYADFLRQHGVEGVNLTRAGYLGAQQYPIHWTGDQKSTFPELRAQLVAALSAGLSGVLFMGSDLSGFAGEMPGGELYRRGVSFAAFSGLMQFHSEPAGAANNDRSPWNMAELLHDPGLLDFYRAYANLRMSLAPYLYSESRRCVEEGRPLMAHLIFDYPDDPEVRGLEDCYLLGHSLLVAPVLESGVCGRSVYLPEGEWADLFRGKVDSSGWRYYSCGDTEIPVFLKRGAMLPLRLGEDGILGGSSAGLPEEARPLDGLTLLCFGDIKTEYRYGTRDRTTLRLMGRKAELSANTGGRLTLALLDGTAPEQVVVNGESVCPQSSMVQIGSRVLPAVTFEIG